jgi:O-succinylbenzoic acid--CoA ligase
MQLFSPLSDELFQPSSDFEQEVLDFCQSWKNGQSKFLFHTSGSTGDPQPIWLDRLAMEASALNTGQWLNLNSDDVALLCLPIQSIAGAMVIVRACVLNLQVCLVEPSKNPLIYLPKISIHIASFVPNQWFELIDSGIDLLSYFHEAKGVLLGGASLSKELQARSLAFSFPIFETYGMTETVSHVAFKKIDANVYQCFDFIDIEVDERNCLRIRGAVTLEQWIQTNDVVKLLSDSTFELLGRFDRIVNSAGRKIQPERLEEFIGSQSSKPTLFFIDALTDSILGQKLMLFYTGEWDLFSQNALKEILKDSFETWKLPKQFIHLPTFQFTHTGKIDRLKSVALYLKSK